MPQRHKDWFAQAEQDLQAAADSFAAGHYEWCAFQSQQASEKAMKALLLHFNQETRGHSVVHLVQQARGYVKIPRGLLTAARELDRHYIQSRYPNGFPEGYPREYYEKELAQKCLSYGQKILDFVKGIIT
jgi:HEPN domain-containing protein